ncbi:MAG: polysaccharide biosynthesis tyrosine autokinase [Candidatus Symbiothrix sp.]|jgi:capsular exopolysaccharide synthesis family protein|nr:polysaccharide biosynthesis tyrosine autokinase [Candidatus Symbiothrix sp.]
MDNTKNMSNSGKPANEVNIRWFVMSFLRYWKWFALSVVLFLLAGFFYVRYATPVYKVESSVIMKDNKRGGGGNSELAMFESLGYMQRNSANVENEVEVFHSRDLIESVVREYGFYTNYIVEGRFRNTELFGNDNRRFYRSVPIQLLIDSTVLAHLSATLQMKVERTKQGTIKVAGSYGQNTFSTEVAKLPTVLNTPIGDLLLSNGEDGSVLKRDYPVKVVAMPPLRMAQKYLQALKVELSGKNTTIVRFSLKETNRTRGETFLNDLIDYYNTDVMNDKNRASLNAVAFINRSLESLRDELAFSEQQVQEYKETNLGIDYALSVEEENEYQKALNGVDMQLQLLGFLSNEEKAMGKDYRMLPASIGGIEGPLLSFLLQYNGEVVKHDRLLQTATAESPTVIRSKERLIVLRDEVKENIASSFVSLQKQKQQYATLNNQYKANIQQFPRIEREMMELERQHSMLNNLNTSLLSQKQSLELTMAVNAPSAKISESPLAYGPVSPRKSFVYLLCLLLGALFPFLVIALRDFFNNKLSNEEEVERLSDTPVIVSLPVKKDSGYVVISERSTSSMAESFRLLRTNLQFLLNTSDRKVVLVTSMISGEGKTFIATNLAMTFALQYKTLLVGLDIRRPKIGAYLGIPKKPGLLDYLTGRQTDVDKLIEHRVNGTKLDVLISGVVPPNPNELLIARTLDTMFNDLRERYDYIIVDSSPIGSVSDAFSLNRVADASLFVVRKDVSLKASLRLVNDIEREQRLKNLNLVLNGFDDGREGRYGYGYGYSSDEN